MGAAVPKGRQKYATAVGDSAPASFYHPSDDFEKGRPSPGKPAAKGAATAPIERRVQFAGLEPKPAPLAAPRAAAAGAGGAGQAYDPSVAIAAAKAVAAAKAKARTLDAAGGMAREPQPLAAGGGSPGKLRDPEAVAAPQALLSDRAPSSGSTTQRSAGTARSLAASGSKPRFNKRFGDVEVGLTERTVLAEWVRRGRRSLKAKQAADAAKARARRPKGGKGRPGKRARTDRVIELYLDNEEEVERLCLEEPSTIILTQIELLTRRIDAIATGVPASAQGLGPPPGAVRAPPRRAPRRVEEQADFRGRTVTTDTEGPRRRPVLPGIVPSWEETFDRAMQTRQSWERDRGKAQHYAMQQSSRQWREEQQALLAASRAAPKSAEAVDSAEVLAQLRAERARLAALLPRFEAQMSRQRRQKEQRVIDKVEAQQEEIRAAMNARAQELRDQRRKEQEERRRKEEEERAWRRKQQEEEAEIMRLMQEWEEDERRRREAKKEAEEREERRRREEEEQRARKRREEEEEEAEEREARRRREEEEAEERAARRRKEEEEEHRRREQMESRVLSLDRMFDEFEQAADEAGMDDALEDALAELTGRLWCTPPGSPPPEASIPVPDSVPQSARRVPAAQAKQAGSETTAESGEGGDWMARAIAALGGDDESSEGEEAPGDAGRANVADFELLRFTEAIVDRLERLHGQADGRPVSPAGSEN